MTAETRDWLSQNVLVGFVNKRGNAWHWRQGDDNHYEDAIPVEDVRRRLFNWEPVKVEGSGLFSGEYIYAREDLSQDSGLRKICSTTATHRAHGYADWLITNVGNVLDDDVQIGSAGLLRRDTVAWVQIEMPDNRFVNGVEFRPTILATTSLDGTIATTYKAVNTIVVCDNTHSMAMAEKAEAYKVKHTRHSKFVVNTARERLKITLERQADAFEAEVQAMVQKDVSDKQFSAFLDLAVPVPSEPGRGRTLAERKRDKLTDMWDTDRRVTMWKNTVWGVFQLINTYEQHERIFKGERAESTLMATITGKTAETDAVYMAYLDRILASA